MSTIDMLAFAAGVLLGGIVGSVVGYVLVEILFAIEDWWRNR